MEHLDSPLQGALELCRFIANSPSPWHLVQEAVSRLVAAGFRPLEEGDAWSLKPGGAYYVVRADSSLIAFRLGEVAPSEGGFKIVGTHSDSPNLRLKPRAVQTRHGYSVMGVEVYGSPLLYSWIDRDLGLAGRLLLRDPSSALISSLIRIDEPLARVASLAIHLDRDVNEKGLVLNRQTHLPPILGLGSETDSHAQLFKRLADEAGCEVAQIEDFDLALYDLTPPRLGGLHQEFIFASRLDNQASCFTALSALIQSPTPAKETRMISIFDHEEIGSGTANGAGGPFLRDVLERICLQEKNPEALHRALAKSFYISADMAHAVHPHHADRQDPEHLPVLNGGPVLKTNVARKYATDGFSAATFRALCREAGVPCQEFVSRGDMACGSTIGPIVAAHVGMPTVDIGCPMLSMHSCREMAGSADPSLMVRVLQRFMS